LGKTIYKCVLKWKITVKQFKKNKFNLNGDQFAFTLNIKLVSSATWVLCEWKDPGVRQPGK
jgi:hypothetical protein